MKKPSPASETALRHLMGYGFFSLYFSPSSFFSSADLTVMPGGEHWFHTPEQMQFLDDWMKNLL